MFLTHLSKKYYIERKRKSESYYLIGKVQTHNTTLTLGADTNTFLYPLNGYFKVVPKLDASICGDKQSKLIYRLSLVIGNNNKLRVPDNR